jgi:hypothetical protein
MQEIFWEVLLDTAKMIPLLFLVYFTIGLIERKFGNKLREKAQRAGKIGPLVGAIAGSLPQCGFSVITTALYTQRLVTIGTLLAVYLSTSDEAIPIILSQPDKAYIVLPLIITKIIIALIAGYVIDFVFRKTNKEILAHVKAYSQGKDKEEHNHESVANESACCGHKSFSFHPIIHTIKIIIFIFIISLLINIAIFQIGEKNLEKLFSGQKFLQPFFAALIGLIPNCAASVVITELYLKGLITYGSVISGLCASAGLGILVLFREEKNKRNVFLVLFLLFGISVLAGIVFNGIIR